MKKTFYLPKADKDKAIWLNNFAGKFATLATTLGFTAADATAVNNDAAMFTYLINLVETFTTEKEERVNYKNLLKDGPIGSPVGLFPAMPVIAAPPATVPAGIFPRTAQIVQRIKNHPNYTEAIGKDLGIIGAEQTINAAGMKPVLKLIHKGGTIEVQWAKGNADSIRIEADKTGTGFQFLAVDSVPHYIDNTSMPAQPTTWKYRAMYLINDESVGQWSDIISITVGGQTGSQSTTNN